MKIQYYVLLTCYILTSIKCFSQSNEKRYYYAYNEKILLNEVDNKLVISCNKLFTSDINSQISNVAKIEWQNDSVGIITTVASQKESLKEDLSHMRGIKSLQLLYEIDNGCELGITNEIVMKFNRDVSQSRIEELHKKYKVTVLKATNLYQLISVPFPADVLDVANQYQLSGLVKYSHPNFLIKAEKHQSIPNDPYFLNQFYLHNTGQMMANGHSGTSGADINAPEAWNITKGNGSVVVAVLDEGVTNNHPDLPGSSQIRLNGSNFASGDVNDPSPVGDDNHGNSCTGVIAASHNNEGVAGIAPNCKIMPIRIPFGNYSSSIYASAITFAKENGAHIISNSWGYGTSNPNAFPNIKDAIEDATTTGREGKGCVVVFSAGNTANHVYNYDGYIQFPANVDIEGVLTVGASDRYDTQSAYSPTSDLYSSYNQIIDIVAPSHRAYSCQISTETLEAWTIDIPNSDGYNNWKVSDDCLLPLSGTTFPSSGTNYLAYTGYFGGTSCSCPEVAAVASLILSLDSNLTQLEVADIIESTARKAGSYVYQTTSGIPNGTWNAQMGHGVLDAYAAVMAACPTSVDFVNQTITTDTNVISCGDINVQNVSVENGAKLTLDAATKTVINGDFEVVLGSELEIK